MENQNGSVAVPEITNELLEEAVRSEKGTDDVTVIAFKSKAGSKKGDNYQSIITAVEVQVRVKGKVETCHYIVKQMPNDPTRRKWLEQVNTFGREMQVYAIIIPALEDVQKQFKPKNPVTIKAPKMYSSLKQTEFLVFDNLVQEGYKMGNKYTGLDYDHCRLAMKELAKFHALSYALKKQVKDLEQQYPALVENMFTTDGEKMVGPFFDTAYDMAIKAVAADDSDLAERMKKLVGNVYQTCADIRFDTEGLEVICHGDFWVNNMMFKYEKKGDAEVPVAVKVLDFQMIRVASPTLDLLYFFYCSTTLDLRQKHMNDLLKLYHDTLCDTIHSMGLDWPELTFQRLSDKFEKDKLFGYFFACLALPFMVARPEESFSMEDIPEMDLNEMSEGFAKQMEESMSKLKGNNDFLERLKGIAIDVQESGLI